MNQLRWGRTGGGLAVDKVEVSNDLADGEYCAPAATCLALTVPATMRVAVIAVHSSYARLLGRAAAVLVA